MPNRLVVMVFAAVVGVVFATGLFMHSRIGGVLVLAVDGVLIALTRFAWNRVPTKGRPVRVAVVAVVGLIGVVKLIHG